MGVKSNYSFVKKKQQPPCDILVLAHERCYNDRNGGARKERFLC